MVDLLIRRFGAGRVALLGELIRYGIVGVLNTAVGLGTILILQTTTSMGPYWANAGGYTLGLIVSFFLNRAWTFAARDRVVARVIRFLVGFLVAYGVNLLVLHLLLQAGSSPIWSQVAANVVYSILFFFICKFFVFRRRA